jgi:hypothetical protein
MPAVRFRWRIVAAAIGALCSPSFARVVYQTDFEAPAYAARTRNGQDGWATAGGPVVSNSVNFTGNQAVLFDAAVLTPTAMARHPFTYDCSVQADQAVTIELHLFLSSATQHYRRCRRGSIRRRRRSRCRGTADTAKHGCRRDRSALRSRPGQQCHPQGGRVGYDQHRRRFGIGRLRWRWRQCAGGSETSP